MLPHFSGWYLKGWTRKGKSDRQLIHHASRLEPASCTLHRAKYPDSGLLLADLRSCCLHRVGARGFRRFGIWARGRNSIVQKLTHGVGTGFRFWEKCVCFAGAGLLLRDIGFSLS